MDDVSKLCKGCWRTIDEIIAWSSHNDEAKKEVWQLIELRKNFYRKSPQINTETKL
jgi:predicted Fe-S protein YdhL (DUF1289 family)